MDFSQLETIIRWVLTSPVTSSPLTFAALTGLATAFVWLAVAPTRTQAQKDGRLDGYLHGRDIIEDLDMSRSFLMRVVVPAMRKGLDSLAALSPGRDVRRVQQMLIEAGQPGGLTAPDIFGLQILSAVGLVALYLLIVRVFGFLQSAAWLITLRNGALLALVGYLLPRVWLRGRVRQRQGEIIRNFSNALDLLSVSVDAGPRA